MSFLCLDISNSSKATINENKRSTDLSARSKMIPIRWTPDPDQLFNLNNILIVGWLTLVFAPFKRLSKYFVLLPSLFLAVIYSVILLRTLLMRNSNSPPLDFFHLSGWLALLKDPWVIIGTVNHRCIMDLWVGQWMVNDFYTGYTFAYRTSIDAAGTYQTNTSWTLGRLVFTGLLFITYMVAPLGFLLYHLAKYSFLKNYHTQVRINVKHGHTNVYFDLFCSLLTKRISRDDSMPKSKAAECHRWVSMTSDVNDSSVQQKYLREGPPTYWESTSHAISQI